MQHYPPDSRHVGDGPEQVRFVPTTALSMRNKLREQKAWNSLNQLISLCDEERRHFETKRFGGLEIDHHSDRISPGRGEEM